MPTVFDPRKVTVLMPVGGRATRSLEVTGDVIPKHLIKLGNNLPILEVVCQQLQIVGFRRFVFCTGHHQEQITDFVTGETWMSYDDVSYQISVESRPLGPEGAILAAITDLGVTGQAMFVTGDNLIPWDGLVTMNEIHAQRSAAVTVGLTSFVTERTTDVGKIVVNATDGRIVRVFGMLVGWRKYQCSQSAPVVNGDMKLEAVVPALPVLTELGNALGYLVPVSPDWFADGQHSGVGKAERSGAPLTKSDWSNHTIWGSSRWTWATKFW